MTREPEPVDRDSRGILDPLLFHQRVRLTRYPVSAALAGLIDRFWAVSWDLPVDVVHRQQVLTHPAANLSVGHPDAQLSASGNPDDPPGRGVDQRLEARVNGVETALNTRHLSGQGWAVAAMTTPGGLGAFVSGSVADLTDRVVPFDGVIDVDEAGLLHRIAGEPGQVGYADQAHLVRDFRAATGQTPARYATSQRLP
jgi:hypothetical protein